MNNTSIVAKALASSTGERGIARFLKANPEFLYWAFFDCGGHAHYVLPEFGIGKSLRCDFMLLQGYSTGWKVHFLELEPIDDAIYNSKGIESPRLRHAQKQIGDWARYVHANPTDFRNQLADAARTTDVFNKPRDKEPLTFSGKYLRDPRTYITYKYYIMIGRRTALSEQNDIIRSSYGYEHDIEIMTYDRLLSTAKRYDDMQYMIVGNKKGPTSGSSVPATRCRVR